MTGSLSIEDILPFELRDSSPRRGKWTEEEGAYTARIVGKVVIV